MRREILYLNDIIEATGHVAAFTKNLDFLAFEESELHRSAVIQKLTVIGEAAARLPDELKAQHPEVPWQRIVAFRNILVHAYFGMEWEIVWRAATTRCPALRRQIEAIAEAESGLDR
jgi:uncharacterized protein with HEPN domain